MWRRAASTQLRSLTSEWRFTVTSITSSRTATRSLTSPSSPSAPSQSTKTSTLFSQKASSDADMIMSRSKKRVEDIMPIATGHEREELQAELEGRNLLEINYPVGPFGTKEAPAVVKSVYDKRIVGCPGGEDEDEHDVVWFWLEKGKPYECPVCSQHFVLEVVGNGGSPHGHGDDDDDH